MGVHFLLLRMKYKSFDGFKLGIDCLPFPELLYEPGTLPRLIPISTYLPGKQEVMFGYNCLAFVDLSLSEFERLHGLR